jgi:DUF971 family protein
LTTAVASACRLNIYASKARRPRCRGTDPGRRLWSHVGIIGLEPVGNYAVRITFDDLHDTGIFSWAYLYELGVEHEKRWREYLEGLAANGLSREPLR